MTRTSPASRRYRYPAMILAVLLLAVVGSAVILGARKFASDVVWVSHTHDTIEAVTLLHTRVRDIESMQRGYVLTGQDDYLAQFRIGVPEITTRAQQILELVADNPTQNERAHELAELSAERVAISDRVISLYQTEGFERARQEIVGNHGKEVMDQIVQLVQTMQAEERRLLAAREVSSNASAANLQWAAVLGIGLSLALIGVVFALMQRENRVRRQAEQLAESSTLQLARSVEGLRLASARLNELRRSASMLQSCRSTDEAMEIARQSFARLFPDAGGGIYRRT